MNWTNCQYSIVQSLRCVWLPDCPLSRALHVSSCISLPFTDDDKLFFDNNFFHNNVQTWPRPTEGVFPPLRLPNWMIPPKMMYFHYIDKKKPDCPWIWPRNWKQCCNYFHEFPWLLVKALSVVQLDREKKRYWRLAAVELDREKWYWRLADIVTCWYLISCYMLISLYTQRKQHLEKLINFSIIGSLIKWQLWFFCT